MSRTSTDTNCTVDAAQTPVTDVTTVNTNAPKMSLEETRTLSDAELLEMAQKAQGHSNDFSEHMHCNFSHSSFSNLLQERGYKKDWHKVSEGVTPVLKPDVIKLKKTDSVTTRKSYIVPNDVAAKWKQFNKDIPCPSVTLAAAMERFMADYRAGKIKFEIGIDI